MIRGPARVLYLLVVAEDGYEPFLVKGRQLIVDEKGYAS